MNPEITTAAERGPAAAEAEPRLTLTELQSLLRDAAAVERASRPIVIKPSTDPAVTVLPTEAGYAPLQHPGISIRVPNAAEETYVVPWAPLRHPVPVRAWGATLAYLGVGALLAGAADGVVAGDSPLSVGGCIVGLAVIIAGLIRSQFEDGAR